ncbi:MAG: hypothetical protein J6S67_03115 [Methanobrevibacter sp.]|nr:hypothetical protein [Methanobrevibacter sp.]
MKKIVFRYKDQYSHGQWNIQECIVENREECIEIYGLKKDPNVYDWEIISEEEVK